MVRTTRNNPRAQANSLRGKSSVVGESKARTNPIDLVNSPAIIADILAKYAQTSLPGAIFPEITSPTGLVLYSQADADDFGVEGIGRRNELGEYPMIRVKPSDLREARTDDIGGKNLISDEALDAGDSSLLDNVIAAQGMGIRARLNDLLIGTLEQITADDGPGQSFVTDTNWHAQSYIGDNPTPEDQRPWSDIVMAKRLLRNHGLAATASHLILDEDTADALSILHGPGKLTEEWGLEVFTAPQVPAGTAYLIAAAGFGNLVTKSGVEVETWREPSVRGSFIQSYCEPVVVVHRPTNIVKITGIDGI